MNSESLPAAISESQVASEASSLTINTSPILEQCLTSQSTATIEDDSDVSDYEEIRAIKEQLACRPGVDRQSEVCRAGWGLGLLDDQTARMPTATVSPQAFLGAS